MLCVPDDPVAGLIDDESCGDPRLRVGGDCQLSDIKDDLYTCSLFLFSSSQTPAFFCVHSKQKQKESKISCKGEKGNAANLIENWAKQSTTKQEKSIKKQFLWILLSYLNCESVLWLINYN